MIVLPKKRPHSLLFERIEAGTIGNHSDENNETTFVRDSVWQVRNRSGNRYGSDESVAQLSREMFDPGAGRSNDCVCIVLLPI